MVLVFFQILVAILLIAVVLLQAQGSGIAGGLGGGGEFYRTRQSAQKFLVIATVVLSILFASLSLILLIFPK